MNDPLPVLVYGSTEFGAVVRDLAIACGHRFAGFIDDWGSGEDVLGPLTRVHVSHRPDEHVVALAIGYKHIPARKQVADRVRGLGYVLASLVHPRAYVAPNAQLDAGVMVMAGASVDVRARIGELTVLWPGAIVSHDCVIVGNSFISPGATICGHSRIGEGSFLGAGSIVVDHVALSPGSFLRAGEVFKGDNSAVAATSDGSPLK
jgi:sugar O-acyltransferase (sialic acid O-acetyltransferase NeuD family)